MENFYLTREQSRAIKGLLIFLIVLGHNAVFTNALPGSFMYIYLFHVQAFFMLPFLYNIKERESFKASFSKNFIRLYYPYILFFIILSALNYGVINILGQKVDLNTLFGTEYSNNFLYFINAILTGNYYLIDSFTALQYLWFLPVMFSMMLLINLNPTGVKKYMLGIAGVVSYVLFIVFMYKKPYSDIVNFEIMKYSPFAIFQGIGVWFMGMSFVSILRNNKTNKLIKYSPVLFVAFSVLFFMYRKTDLYYLIRFFMPFFFMGTIWLLRDKISRIDFLKKFGDLSFPIYIIHPLLCSVLYLVCQKYFEINLIYACIVQLVVFIISYYIAHIINKLAVIRKLLFPRSWEELKSVVKFK